MPAPHHSVFYRPDALPAAQPTHKQSIIEYTRHNMVKFKTVKTCNVTALKVGKFAFKLFQRL